MNPFRPSRAEEDLRDARQIGVLLALALRDAQVATTTELARMRAEIASLRAESIESDRRVVGDALEVVREAGRQTGLAQAQAIALADSDALLQLAGDLVAAGALEHLNDHERALDVASRA
jgi:hypothetical protein